MKRISFICLAVFILFLILFCIVMEVRYQGTTITEVNMTEEEVLKEMPSIEVTEKDREMAEYLFSLAEVDAMFKNLSEENPFVDLPAAETERLLGNYMPEDYDTAVLSVFHDCISLQMMRGEKESLIYIFFNNGNEPQKTIGIYRDGFSGRTCVACYTNDTMGIRKFVPKHQWFGWLREIGL